MANNSPDISVVIPVKDRKESLLRAISSVTKQTYTVREIIVVDDGSKENLEGSLRDFSVPVTYLRNAQSMGAPHARNRGWRHAASDLIAFLDSDDEFTPNCLKDKVDKLIADNLDLVVGSFTIEQNRQLKQFKFSVNGNHSLRDHLLMNTPFDARTSTFVMKREALQKISFDEKLKKHQDWDLFINVDAAMKTGFTNQSDVIMHISESDRISTGLKHDSTRYFIEKNRTKVSPDAMFLFGLKMLYKSAIRNDEDGKQLYRSMVIDPRGRINFSNLLISKLIRWKVINVSFLHSLKRLLISRK